MKKKLLVTIIVLFMFLLCSPVTTMAKDDYPYAGQRGEDPWAFYKAECTSFAAHCIVTRDNVPFHNYYLYVQWGHAKNWGYAAKQVGIPVDTSPSKGSIAWSTAGEYGHVAYVSAVNGNNVTVEEYNYQYYPNDHKYGTRTVNSASFTGFIHFEKINGSNVPKPPTTQNVTPGIYNIQNVGTGKFLNYAYTWNTSFAGSYPMVIYPADGSSEQKFTLKHDGTGKYQLIINYNNMVVNCLTDGRPSAGTMITGYRAVNDDTQRFYLNPVGNGEYIIQSAANPNVVLAPVSSSNYSYVKLQNYSKGNADQKWKLVSVSKQTTLSKPAISSAKNLNSGIQITWNKVSNAKGYYIYRDNKYIANVKNGSTVFYTDTGIKNKNGVKYTYKIIAYSGATKSPVSASKSLMRLTAPKIYSMKNGSSKKMTISWDKNTKATSYEIMISTSQSFLSSWIYKNISINTTTLSFGNLVRGTVYYVKMRAVNGSVYSEWSGVSGIKIIK